MESIFQWAISSLLYVLYCIVYSYISIYCSIIYHFKLILYVYTLCAMITAPEWAHYTEHREDQPRERPRRD